jgi:hypothetical protein
MPTRRSRYPVKSVRHLQPHVEPETVRGGHGRLLGLPRLASRFAGVDEAIRLAAGEAHLHELRQQVDQPPELRVTGRQSLTASDSPSGAQGVRKCILRYSRAKAMYVLTGLDK